MDFTTSLLLSIAGSVVGSVILSFWNVIAKLTPPKLRKSIDWEYKNQKSAIRRIKKDASNSTSLRVLTMKGDTFSSPTELGDLHFLLNNTTLSQQYLISDPHSPYVKIRGKELNSKTFQKSIEQSVSILKDASNTNNRIQVLLHEECLRFRLIIFDQCLYISFQPNGISGRESPMQRYLKSSAGYSALEMLFDNLWKKYNH